MATTAPGVEAKTSIDALVELLRKKGKMDANTIAGTLGISPAIVESWAKVLEKGGIVKISYEVGRLYVAPVTLSPEQAKIVASKTEVKRSIVGDDLAAQRSKLEKFATEIGGMSTEVSSLERIYQQRMPAVQQMLSQINALYDSIVEQGKAVDQIKKNAEDSYQGVNRRIDELSSKIDSIGNLDTGKLKKGAQALGTTQDAVKDAHEAYEALNSLSKSKDRLFDSLKQNMGAQVDAFKKQADATRQEVEAQLRISNERIAGILAQLNAQNKNSRDLASHIDSFKKEMVDEKKHLNAARVQFTDRYEHLEGTMKKASEQLSQDSRAILDKLGDLKAAFGDVARIDSELRDIRKGIDEISSQIAKSRANVMELQQTMDALGTMSLSPSKRMDITSELEQKAKDSGKAISQIGKTLEDTKGKLNDAK